MVREYGNTVCNCNCICNCNCNGLCEGLTVGGCISQKKSKEHVVSFLTAYAPQHTFTAAGKKVLASIHGVLLGHEDWVHAVSWIPRYVPTASHTNKQSTQPPENLAEMTLGDSKARDSWVAHPQHALQLLTASMDRTIMIWGPDKASGLWMCEECVGDAGVLPCCMHVL